MRRPCITCGIPSVGPRCPAHTMPGPSHSEQRRRREAVAAHVARYGHVCPGWDVPTHASFDLTADHVVPRSRGGEYGELRVYCRPCNSRRGDGTRTPSGSGGGASTEVERTPPHPLRSQKMSMSLDVTGGSG